MTEDAFYLSHTSEIVDVPEPEIVKEYLPKFDLPHKLDVSEPHGFGSLSMPHQWFPELKYNIAEAMDLCEDRIEEADREYQKLTGRSTGGLIDEYRCDDAEVVLMCSGTMASTAKEVADMQRDQGRKVGVARMRVFRPFPVKKVRALADRVKMLGVLDRSYCFGYQGALGTEVQGALYQHSNQPPLKNYIVGWGGRDVTVKVLGEIYDDAYNVLDNGLDREVQWVNLKGEAQTPRWGVV
jgi:pyruvate/2-oxoacid:ferredoxin oxidoreductase alpha subunit